MLPPQIAGGVLGWRRERTPGNASIRLTIWRLERHQLLVGRVGCAWRGHAECREALGLHPDVHAKQAIEALAEQAGADQQHHGHRQFDDHELRADAAPRRSRRSRDCHPQGPPRFPGGREHGRDERGAPRQRPRDRAGKAGHARVQAEAVQERHRGDDDVRRDEARQQLDGPIGGRQAEGAAAADEDQPLCHELADDPRRRRTKCRPDGDLPPASLGADQQQACDVHAGDDQQQPGAAEQHHRSGRILPTITSSSGSPGSLAAIGIRVLLLELLRDRIAISAAAI